MKTGVKHVDFLKVSGAGNDFILIDNISRSFDIDWVAFAKVGCSRPFGIGSDGLLILEPSPSVDFLMRYYNADGSFGGMCGNGGRCVARYAFERGIAGRHVRFEALDHVYEASVGSDGVTLKMKDAVVADAMVKFNDGRNNTLAGWPVDSGSPHVVIRPDDLKPLDVEQWGRLIRNDPSLSPQGTNVDFYIQLGERVISLRTYERGVEAETMACGTGAVAAAVVSVVERGGQSPIAVSVKSGEILRVGFRQSGKLFTDVTLQGSAHLLFTGSLLFDRATGKILEVEVSRFETQR
jgi:diaminopimelate epimerase